MKDMRIKVTGFLEEYQQLCEKYGLSLAHEDNHGAFIITEYKEDNIDWVKSSLVHWHLDEEEIKRQQEVQAKIDSLREELYHLVGAYSEGNLISFRDNRVQVYNKDKELIRYGTKEENRIMQTILALTEQLG